MKRTFIRSLTLTILTLAVAVSTYLGGRQTARALDYLPSPFWWSTNNPYLFPPAPDTNTDTSPWQHVPWLPTHPYNPFDQFPMPDPDPQPPFLFDPIKGPWNGPPIQIYGSGGVSSVSTGGYGNPYSVTSPQAVLAFTVTDANGNEVTAGNSAAGNLGGCLVEPGWTFSAFMNPRYQSKTNVWPAFAFNNGTSTVTNYMQPGCCVGTWTYNTNSAGGAYVTNVLCDTSGGRPVHQLDIWPCAFPRGINVVSNALTLTVMLSGVTNTGASYSVESKTDLGQTSWTAVTNVVSSSTNTTNGVLYVSFGNGGSTNLFLRARTIGDVSSVVGYYTVAVGAGKMALVADQLLQHDHRMRTLWPNAPVGSMFVSLTNTALVTNTCTLSGWSDQTAWLTLSQGGWFYNPLSSPITLTFEGSVADGGMEGGINAGGTVFSVPLPMKSGAIPGCAVGDSVSRYVPATGGWTTYVYTNLSFWVTNKGQLTPFTNSIKTNFVAWVTIQTWQPALPSFGVGEACWIDTVLTNLNWTLPTRAFPSVDGLYAPGVTNYMYDYLVNYPTTSARSTNTLLLFRDCPGMTNQVQSAPTPQGPWTTKATVIMNNSEVMAVPVGIGTTNTFFRVKH